MMSTILNAAFGAIAIGSFLVVCFMKKRKIKLTHLINALQDPYFHPMKKLNLKDEVFVRMLENCQNVGPCYVITDPAIQGTCKMLYGWFLILSFHELSFNLKYIR